MDLRDYLDILRARWRLIIVTTLLGVMAAALASMLATPLYTSTATTFVSVNGGDPTVGTALQGDLFAQSRVKSYVGVATADDVMNAVIEDLGLPLTPRQLAGKTISIPLHTVPFDFDMVGQLAEAVMCGNNSPVIGCGSQRRKSTKAASSNFSKQTFATSAKRRAKTPGTCSWLAAWIKPSLCSAAVCQ